MTPAGSNSADAPELPNLPRRWQLHDLDVVDSTNAVARALGEEGAAEGQVVWAREQRSGRARRGRGWYSPPGNLYCSVLLRPGCTPSVAGQLSFLVAVAMADAVREIAPTIEGLCLKWPNDLIVRRSKLAGILLESAILADGAVDWVVAGTGVNIDSHPKDVDYPATDLAAEGYPGVLPGALLESYAAALDHWLARWRVRGFEPVRDAWKAQAAGIGETITVRLDRELVIGRFELLDEDGALHLVLGDGSRRRFTAGDVFFGES